MRWIAAALLPLTMATSWIDLGGSGSAGGLTRPSWLVRNPSLALDSTGYPWIAWEGGEGSVKAIRLLRWDGAAWVGVGGSETANGLSDGLGNEQPSLALDSQNRPAVSWTHSQTLYVRHWNGSAWEGYGNSDNNNGISGVSSFNSRIRLDASDRPTVVWEFIPPSFKDQPSSSQVYLKRWTGNSWQELGGSATGGGVSNAGHRGEAPDLAIGADGHPVVAWSHSDVQGQGFPIYVKRWTGSNWEELGGSASGWGISGVGGQGSFPSVALDSTGNPVVAWHEYGRSEAPYGAIYLRRWNGSFWEELGGSATGSGLSAFGSGGARYPSLKLGPSDRPVVAWGNGPGFSTDEIYVKAWDGAGWVELAGSATGGGVSDTASVSSTQPSLALTPAGEPAVAWIEDIFGVSPRLYYRQLYNPPPAPAFAVRTVDPSPIAGVEEVPPELRISLTLAPDPLTVNGVSVVLTSPGKDRVLDTEDDVELAPQVSVSGDQITLNLRDLKLSKGVYRLRLRGTDGFGPGGALRDGLGRLLDGDFGGTFPSGNGTPGGDFVVGLPLGQAPPRQR